METKLYNFLILLLMMVVSACGGGNPDQAQKQRGASSQKTGAGSAEKTPSVSSSTLMPKLSSETADGLQEEFDVSSIDVSAFLQKLDELAEIERSGAWFQGIAIAESRIRENAGDFAGAVTAAYKELSWARGLGLIQKADVEQGLLNALDLKSDEGVDTAVNAILAFEKERWSDAIEGFSQLKQRSHLKQRSQMNQNTQMNQLASSIDEIDEPDSFFRWMMLVCALENNKISSNRSASSDRNIIADRNIAAAYGSIRARYAPFPEYWYRGARAFSGAVAAEYAENCINLAPNGPFAEECRKIIASYTGLKSGDGSSIKTKKEIETIVNLSINSGNPQLLNSLLPLIGLPDNPYTVYAVGVLRSLTNIPGFKDYFNKQATAASGRLAERLSYICRG